MLSLARAVRRGLQSGEPLPDAYPILAAAKVRFRRGGLHLLAGQPGAMKTLFALNLAQGTKVPTLYFSNDSDELTVSARVLARQTQTDVSEIEKRIGSDPSWASKNLSTVEHIRWSFHSSPNLADIEEEMHAFEEMYGEYPALVVVDILLKVDYAEDSEHASLSRIMSYLDFLARDSGACFIVVHHTTEAERGNPCQSRAAVLQKVNQLPVLILTVAHKNGRFYVAPVKNRYGPDDHTGNTALEFYVDASRSTIREDYPSVQATQAYGSAYRDYRASDD